MSEAIQVAKNKMIKFSCFVAGTLVHVQEGLLPIEQIKVGDYVLSKPESGIGEPSYQRVTRTFEHDRQEVYLIRWLVRNAVDMEAGVYGHMVVTGAHPVWVKDLKDHHGGEWNMDERLTAVNAWMSIEDIYLLHLEKYWKEESNGTGVYPQVELIGGKVADIFRMNPILQSADQNIGIGFGDDVFWRDNGSGAEVLFSDRGPVLKFNGVNRPIEGHLDIELTLDYDYTGYDYDNEWSVASRSGGFLPIRRKVFNIEVENNHSYYVTEAGVWVHNTCGPESRRRR